MCATSEQVNRFYMFFSCYVYIVCSGNSIHSVMCIVLWNIGWIERFTWISLRRRFNVLQRGNIWIKRKISKRRLVVEKKRSISIESKIWMRSLETTRNGNCRMAPLMNSSTINDELQSIVFVWTENKWEFHSKIKVKMIMRCEAIIHVKCVEFMSSRGFCWWPTPFANLMNAQDNVLSYRENEKHL